MVTLGGWLTEQLGDIPKAGTKYVTHRFSLSRFSLRCDPRPPGLFRRLKAQAPKEKS